MLPPRGSCREAAEGETPNRAAPNAWIRLDLEVTEECYPKILSTSQTGTTTVASFFDRLAESICMDTSPWGARPH